MKRNILRYAAVFSAYLALFWACSPDEEVYLDNSRVDMNEVSAVKLKANHYMLLADGKAMLEFRPELYNDSGYVVPSWRVNRDELEYYTLSGTRLPADYSTSDASLVGKTLEVYAKVKATGLISDTVSFEIVDPTFSAQYRERTIPVVFHIVQTREEITSYGGNFSQAQVENILQKMNNAFSGKVSTSPVGVDTKIRFKLAAYNVDGRRMIEPGINRVTVESIDGAGDYAPFIKNQHLMWPYDQYLNIWVISASEVSDGNFGPKITARCTPRYVNSEDVQKPEGLNWALLPSGWEPMPEEIGVIFKLQVFNKQGWRFSNSAENELIHYIGGYLGLLKTFDGSSSKGPEDYCSDTFSYGNDRNAYKSNATLHKSVGKYFFLSENIMDDPTGMHRSVSREQCERIHWVLENCPERSAWKSDFAFTGNK